MIINASKEKTWNSITDLNKKRYINYLNRYDLYYMCKDEIKRLHKGDNKNLKNESKEDYNDYQHIQKGDFIVIKKSPNEIFSKLIIDGISEEKDKNELILVCNKTEKQPQMENKINLNSDSNDPISNSNNIKNNNISTVTLKENVSLSSPPSINNNNNNSYLDNDIYTKKISELKLKRKKTFGNKIKLIDWGSRGLIGTKENEVDIISYLNKKKKIDRDELCMKFNINPSFQERQILDSIITKNPMINIRN